MQEMEDFKRKLELDEARVTQVGHRQEDDRFSHDTCNSIRLCVEEAKDMREMIQNLAQQIEVLQSVTNPGAASSGHNPTPEPVSSENSVPVTLEINDFKTKVAHLIEQVDQHNREVGHISPVMQRVDLIEDQIHRWRIRLPDMFVGRSGG